MNQRKSMVLFIVFVALYWKYILGLFHNLLIKEMGQKCMEPGTRTNVHVSYIIGKSLQVIPERATLRYINEKYIQNATVIVKRYGRKSGYYINVEAFTLMEFGNNVSLNLIFYEFLHNEYKRSFVEMKFDKICDSIQKDPYVGRGIKMAGLPCPIPPGFNKMMNVTVPTQDFPNVWPFEKCKVEATLLQNKNNDIMAIADIYVMFKNKLRA